MVVFGLLGGAITSVGLVVAGQADDATSAPGGPALAASAGPSVAAGSRGALAARADSPIARTAQRAISPPLRDLPVVAQPPTATPEPPERELNLPAGPEHRDAAVQRSLGPNVMPGPLLTWEGVTNNDNSTIAGRSARPPDNTGEMGQNHYVEWVNVLIEIFDRAGTTVSGPVPGNSLFVNLPGTTDVCETTNQGDPLVHYDQLANRWVLSQFAFNVDPVTGAVVPPFHECVAVSTSPDPTGTYCTYSLFVSNTAFNDYPKMGVWPNAYFFSFNMFAGGVTYAGPAAMAVDRADLLNCNATADYVVLDPTNTPALANQQPFLPSDLDGTTEPPAGSPNYFIGLNSTNNGLLLRKFQANFAVAPPTGTLTAPTTIPVTPFDRSFTCSPARECIPQKDTLNKLDVIADRVMMRLAYRNFGTHESLVVNHTVDADTNHAGVRWYELRDPNAATPIVHQQSTFAPDAHNRWMGSAAMDRRGDLAIGYSVSSTTLHPSIRYAGRLAGDPLNNLSQGEAELLAGTFSAPDTAFTGGDPRWGDYTHLVTDPLDDCTFWYINEHQRPEPIGDGTLRRWATRIGSFKFTECQAPTAAVVTGFAARYRLGGATVTWRTAAETDVVGFNLYRARGRGAFVKVNRVLVPAKRAGQARGATYSFLDRSARRGQLNTYRLQVVGRDGKRSWYGIGTAAG